jgi:hypothetical protein
MKIIGDIHIITDDTEAITALMSLGIYNELSDKGSFTEPTTKFVVHAGHPTHFVIGIRIFGHIEESENGYSVQFLAKSKFSRQKVDEVVRNTLKNSCGDILEHKKGPIKMPEN